MPLCLALTLKKFMIKFVLRRTFWLLRRMCFAFITIQDILWVKVVIVSVHKFISQSVS